MGEDRIECECNSQLSITGPECSCTEEINVRGGRGERSLLQVHSPGKAPPVPAQPQTFPAPYNTNSLSERSGVHTLPAPQNAPLKAEGYVCQLLD